MNQSHISYAEKLIKNLDEIERWVPSSLDCAEKMIDSLVNNQKPSIMPNKVHIRLAKELVRHFYGLDTENYLIDLRMEIDHLGYFAQRINNSECDDELKAKVAYAMKGYHDVLSEYLKILERKSAYDEE